MIRWKKDRTCPTLSLVFVLEGTILEQEETLLTKEHDKMCYALMRTKKYFVSKRRQSSEEERKAVREKVLYLERVLELSETWNGVPTKEFFPNDKRILAYLKEHNIERLGTFFAQPFTELSKALLEMGSPYPPFLQKLYESYYALMAIKKETPKAE